MPKTRRLIDRGDYYELPAEGTGAQILQSVLQNVASIITLAADTKRKKGIEDDRLQKETLSLLEKLPTDRANELLDKLPQLRRNLMNLDALPKEQRKAIETGTMEPFRITLKPTAMETEKLREATASASKEEALLAGAKADTEVKSARAGLLQSEDPYLRLVGLKGSPLSSDEVMATHWSANPEMAMAKLASEVPGSDVYKLKVRDAQLANLMKDYSPKSPQEAASVKEVANWIAGLRTDFPKDAPKSIAGQQLELEKRRVNIAETQANLQAANARLDMNMKVFTMASGLEPRLKGTQYEGQHFDIASKMLLKGEVPTDLPPDISAEAKRQADLVSLAESKVKLENALQSNPKFQMLQQMSQRAVAAGDQKGGQYYLKLMQDEFNKQYGIPAPEPSLWGRILSGEGRGSVYAQWGNWLMNSVKETAALPGKALDAAATAGGGMATQLGGPPTVINPGDTGAPPPAPAAQTGLQTPATGKLGLPREEETKLIFLNDLVDQIGKMSPNASGEQRSKLLQVLQMIKDIRAGRRPFEDIATVLQTTGAQ